MKHDGRRRWDVVPLLAGSQNTKKFENGLCHRLIFSLSRSLLPLIFENTPEVKGSITLVRTTRLVIKREKGFGSVSLFYAF